MIPVPAFTTVCGPGVGMAACPALKLLVTASHNHLTVYALPDSIVAAPAGVPSGLTRLRTIGRGVRDVDPLRFQFMNDCGMYSGCMAFTGSTAASRPVVLVVTDAGNRAVHVIDVVHGRHVGYVVAPGGISNPRSVAAQGTKVAVCTFRFDIVCDVRVYEGSGATWTAVRTISNDAVRPIGLRFSADGNEVVAVQFRGPMCVIRINDGSVVLCEDLEGFESAIDLEECADYGWAVAEWHSNAIQFVGGSCARAGEFIHPAAMAFVPGLGLVVREFGNGGRVQFFATQDAIAMAAMSVMKTTWMATVARAISGK